MRNTRESPDYERTHEFNQFKSYQAIKKQKNKYTKQTCYKCENQIYVRQNQPYFQHSLISKVTNLEDINNTNKIISSAGKKDNEISNVRVTLSKNQKCKQKYCIHCCYKIIKQFKDSKFIKYQCCQKKQFPNGIKQIRQFLQQNCIICGVNCKNTKICLRSQLYLGLQCYKSIKNKQKKSQYQQNVIAFIQGKRAYPCTGCGSPFNLLLSTQKQRQKLMCSNCIPDQKQIQEQYQENKLKKCLICEQPQIFIPKDILKGRFMQKKLFKLVQIKGTQFQNIFNKYNYDKNYNQILEINKINYLCSFCFYSKYIMIQNLKSNKLIIRYQYQKIKKLFIDHFLERCLICGKKNQVDYMIDIFQILYKKRPDYVKAFMCLKCGQIDVRQPNKYQSLIDLRKFMVQNNFIPQNSKRRKMKKDYFQLQVQQIQKLNEKNIKKYKDQQSQLVQQRKIQQNRYTLQNKKYNLQAQDKRYSQQVYNLKRQLEHKFQRQQKQEKRQEEQKLKNFEKRKNIPKNRLSSFMEFQEDKEPLQGPVISQKNNQINQKEQQFQSANEDQDQSVNIQPFSSQNLPDYLKKQLQFDIQQFSNRILSQFNHYPHDHHQNNQNHLNTKQNNHNHNHNHKIINQQQLKPIIIVQQNDQPPKQCQFYPKCKNKQNLLHYNILCQQCFMKYLLGQIVLTQKMRQKIKKEQQQNSKSLVSQQQM